jgi:hypothetical protein
MKNGLYSGTLVRMSAPASNMSKVPHGKSGMGHECAEGQSGSPEPSGEQIRECRSPETGGPAGLEPTRYGDWERSGRCIDF